MYDLIVFDVYGTIFYPSDDEYIYDPGRNKNIEYGFEKLFEKEFSGRNFKVAEAKDVFLSIIDKYHKMKITENNKITNPEILIERIWIEFFNSFFNISISIEKAFLVARFFDSIVNSIYVPQKTIEFFKSLKKFNYKIGLFSNSQQYTLDILDEILGVETFDDYFSILSFRLGFSKPDKLFYDELSMRTEKYGYSKNRVLVVGNDVYKDVLMSKKYGFKTVLVDRFVQGQCDSCADYVVSDLWELEKVLAR